MYNQIENGSFTKKHWNTNYIIFFTVYQKEDFELQEAPHKLPAHLVTEGLLATLLHCLQL
jgi:hypothetical protein